MIIVISSGKRMTVLWCRCLGVGKGIQYLCWYKIIHCLRKKSKQNVFYYNFKSCWHVQPGTRLPSWSPETFY